MFQTRGLLLHVTFQSGGSWAPNPRAGNILSLKREEENILADTCTKDARAAFAEGTLLCKPTASPSRQLQ